jgi:hypothetical protein
MAPHPVPVAKTPAAYVGDELELVPDPTTMTLSTTSMICTLAWPLAAVVEEEVLPIVYSDPSETTFQRINHLLSM